MILEKFFIKSGTSLTFYKPKGENFFGHPLPKDALKMLAIQCL